MKVLGLSVVCLTAGLLAQDSGQDCDFECPTKGKITSHSLRLTSHLSRWELCRPLHLQEVLPVCRLQTCQELLPLRPVLGRHQEVLHVQGRGGVRPRSKHCPAPNYHALPGQGGAVQAGAVRAALVLL